VSDWTNEGLYSSGEALRLTPRVRFLEALERKTTALEKLMEHLPLIQESLEHTSNIHTWEGVNHSALSVLEAAALRDAVCDWSKAHHLTDEWLLDTALHSLYRGYLKEERAKNGFERKPFAFHYKGPKDGCPAVLPDEFVRGTTKDGRPRMILERGIYPNGFTFSFTDIGWIPTDQSKKEFEIFLDEQFELTKQRFFELVTRELERHRLEKPASKRNLKHFDWLAAFQVLGLSPQEITDQETRETHDGKKVKALDGDTVPKALVATAKLIGLTPRVDIVRS
jgi:hypothetical protein